MYSMACGLLSMAAANSLINLKLEKPAVLREAEVDSTASLNTLKKTWDSLVAKGAAVGSIWGKRLQMTATKRAEEAKRGTPFESEWKTSNHALIWCFKT